MKLLNFESLKVQDVHGCKGERGVKPHCMHGVPANPSEER